MNVSACVALSQLPCVFIVALGRTGSTHIQRVINSIPGYRISGETDNAWIYMGWYARAEATANNGAAVADTSGQRRQAKHVDLSQTDTACGIRQMMMLLHNPYPRAR